MFGLRFVLLFITWCAFSGLYDVYHLSLGVMSSLWVAAISNQIALSNPAGPDKGVIRLSFQTVGYLAWLLGQILRANLQVLKLSFSSNLESKLSPKIVEFRTSLNNDFSRFLLAHSITLTPGTVTIRLDGDLYVVHALTEEMAHAVPGEMESRLVKIFGAAQEVPSDA